MIIWMERICIYKIKFINGYMWIVLKQHVTCIYLHIFAWSSLWGVCWCCRILTTRESSSAMTSWRRYSQRKSVSSSLRLQGWSPRIFFSPTPTVSESEIKHKWGFCCAMNVIELGLQGIAFYVNVMLHIPRSFMLFQQKILLILIILQTLFSSTLWSTL